MARNASQGVVDIYHDILTGNAEVRLASNTDTN
jgi:hypothetical protein